MKSRFTNYLTRPKRTREEYAIDYAQYSLHDLNCIIRNRKLVPPRIDEQNANIEVLQEADRSVRFPFFDLPPDLRNMIYRELLSLRRDGFSPDKKQHCWPEILATCRQANDEASDLLYSENRIFVHIYKTSSELALEFVDQRWMPSAYWHLLSGSLDWPKYLRKVQHLRLIVTIEWEKPPGPNAVVLNTGPNTLIELNHVLYDFQCLLSQAKRLQEFEVVYKAAYKPFPDEVLLQVFYPLMLCKGSEANMTFKTGNEGDRHERLMAESTELVPIDRRLAIDIHRKTANQLADRLRALPEGDAEESTSCTRLLESSNRNKLILTGANNDENQWINVDLL